MHDYEPSIIGEDEQMVAPPMSSEIGRLIGEINEDASIGQPSSRAGQDQPGMLDLELLLEKENADGWAARRQLQTRAPSPSASHRMLHPTPHLLQARTRWQQYRFQMKFLGSSWLMRSCQTS